MIVYTAGTFDLMHAGHVDLFRFCREIAGNGRVVVQLNTDEFVEKYKGKKPIMSYDERKTVIEELKSVDEVIKNEGGEDSKPGIIKVNPDVIVIGSDWATKDYYKQMQFTQAWLDERSISLIYFPRTRPLSTTLVKGRI